MRKTISSLALGLAVVGSSGLGLVGCSSDTTGTSGTGGTVTGGQFTGGSGAMPTSGTGTGGVTTGGVGGLSTGGSGGIATGGSPVGGGTGTGGAAGSVAAGSNSGGSAGTGGTTGEIPKSPGFPADYKGKPFKDERRTSGEPAVIPGQLELVLYDLGGEGVAYHDSDTNNSLSNGLNLDPSHQQSDADAYTWFFRKDEAVDTSYVKDMADFKFADQHQNAVDPPRKQLYIGDPSDGEWTRYTVNVKEAGTYRITMLYSMFYKAMPSLVINNTKTVELNLPIYSGQGEALGGQSWIPWHRWNKAEVGTITFDAPGLTLLTYQYKRCGNSAFMVFEKI